MLSPVSATVPTAAHVPTAQASAATSAPGSAGRLFIARMLTLAAVPQCHGPAVLQCSAKCHVLTLANCLH